MRHSFSLSTLIVSIAFTAQAYASAWTQPTGHGQVIINTLYYSADKLFNQQGNRQNQNRFSKYELNPYFEYGLHDDLTVGANLSAQYARQNNPGNTLTNWVLGDSEFFVRKRIWNEGGFVLSVEPMIKLPGASSNQDRFPIASKYADAGLGLLSGYGFSAYGQNHFLSLDTQYRYRMGTPENQVKIAATAGISITEKWMVMPQLFTTLRTSKSSNSAFTQSSGDDYNLHKLQISAVYKLDEKTSLQAGAFSHIAGKNVGEGNGIVLSLWKNF